LAIYIIHIKKKNILILNFNYLHIRVNYWNYTETKNVVIFP